MHERTLISRNGMRGESGTADHDWLKLLTDGLQNRLGSRRSVPSIVRNSDRVAEMTVSRRQFLRGNVRGSRAALGLPWALPQDAFTARCTRCDDCIKACPEAVIRRGSGGYPEMDFSRGACTFCRDCVTACQAGAHDSEPAGRSAAFAHRAVVADSCLAAKGVVCRACGDHCETGAIRFRLAPAGRSFALVDAGRCNGCGGCVRVCPAQAIAMKIIQAAEAAA